MFAAHEQALEAEHLRHHASLLRVAACSILGCCLRIELRLWWELWLEHAAKAIQLSQYSAHPAVLKRQHWEEEEEQAQRERHRRQKWQRGQEQREQKHQREQQHWEQQRRQLEEHQRWEEEEHRVQQKQQREQQREEERAEHRRVLLRRHRDMHEAWRRWIECNADLVVQQHSFRLEQEQEREQLQLRRGKPRQLLSAAWENWLEWCALEANEQVHHHNRCYAMLQSKQPTNDSMQSKQPTNDSMHMRTDPHSRADSFLRG
jgi:hypothetical protein